MRAAQFLHAWDTGISRGLGVDDISFSSQNLPEVVGSPGLENFTLRAVYLDAGAEHVKWAQCNAMVGILFCPIRTVGRRSERFC